MEQNPTELKVTKLKVKKPKKEENVIDWTNFNLLQCERCRLCKTRMNVVPPKIIKDCQVLFVGEAPGRDEDMWGQEPFVGEAGQLLDSMLAEVGIDRKACSLANVVSCRPPENRLPLTDEIKACSPILDRVIQDSNPEIIVPLGKTALKRLTNESSITKMKGKLVESKKYPGKKIIPVIHPSFALRDPSNINALRYGLQKVKAAMDGIIITKTSEVTYVDTLEKFDAMIADLNASLYFAVDIETSSFNWQTGYIICISFSTKAGTSYVLPWIVGDDEFYAMCEEKVPLTKGRKKAIPTVEDFCELYSVNMPTFFWKDNETHVKTNLKAALKNPNNTKILHNYTFDYKFLENADLKMEGDIYDTYIMHFLLDEKKGIHGLDDLTLKYTDYGQYWKGLDEYIKKTKKGASDTYAIIPLKKLIQYAGTDADVTRQIFDIVYVAVEKEGMLTLLNGFLMPLTKMLMKTEKNGFAVDDEYRKKGTEILTVEINKLAEQLKQYGDINYNSPQQLKELLFTKIGLPPIKKTPSGKDSTDEEVLEKLKTVHPVPELLLRMRKLEKCRGTYFEGLGRQMWPDGKVHSTFDAAGTETGRLASRNPNLQNLTRNDPTFDAIGIRVRDIFCSSDWDKYYLVEVDYSQAELRLIAEYSRDKNLYNAFLQGRDPHAELAVRIYHPNRVAEMEQGLVNPKDIVTKLQRQNGKTANFSLVYGKYPDNFATENNLTLEEATHIHKVYWDTYQGITAWKENTLREAYANGYFKTFFGRKRRMGKLYATDQWVRGEAEREGINFVIQGQASDYTLYSILKATAKANEMGLDYRTVSFVHDSGVFEVNKQHIHQFLNLLREVMRNPVGVTLNMEIEAKIGFKLGSLAVCVPNEQGIWVPENK